MARDTFSFQVETYARKILGYNEPTSDSLHCCDGVSPDGKILEVKDFSKNIPSLGGAYVLQATSDIMEAITNYCLADMYAFYMGKNGEFEPENLLVMDRSTAIKWIFDRVILGRSSSKRGGHPLLRVGRNLRSYEMHSKMVNAGYTV